MSYNLLISDPSTCVKKRAQRSDDSILLRHMDDVWWCCAMKATQSTFLGLEITKTSRGFEVKNSRDLVESLLNLFGSDAP